MPPRKRRATDVKPAKDYRHREASTPTRPEVGTQAHFRGQYPHGTYRYDSSLSPALDWDGQNTAREEGETLIRQILEADELAGAKAAAEKLRALGRPFLNWAGKAERLSFEVPTLPLSSQEQRHPGRRRQPVGHHRTLLAHVPAGMVSRAPAACLQPWGQILVAPSPFRLTAQGRCGSRLQRRRQVVLLLPEPEQFASHCPQ